MDVPGHRIRLSERRLAALSLALVTAIALSLTLGALVSRAVAHHPDVSPTTLLGLGDQGLLPGSTGLDVPLGAAAPTAAANAASGEPPLRVYVVVVDGLLPQEVGPLTPTLTELRHSGTWYKQARAVLPAETLPNHAAMMTGMLPQRNGIIANQFDRGGIPKEYMQYPEFWQADTLTTRLERAYSGDIATATILSKEYLYGLFRGEYEGAGDPLPQREADFHWDPRTQPNYVIYPSSHSLDVGTMDATLAWIRAQQGSSLPQFAFVNLGDVDRAGHADEEGIATAAADRATHPQDDELSGTHMTPFRQAAIKSTDTQIDRLVDELKQTGAWDESALIVLSDHGMDWGPQHQVVDTQGALNRAGFKIEDSILVGGGGSELVYVHYQPDIVPMAKALCAADGVGFISTRQPVADLPAGKCGSTTHSEVGIENPRSPDIEVFMEPGWHSSPNCCFNPVPGNHGHSVTQHSALMVAGGHPALRDQPTEIDGEPVYRRDSFAAPAGGPGSVSVAPTVAALFGIGAPADGYDASPLLDAFDPGAVELGDNADPVVPLAGGGEAPEPTEERPDGAPLLTVGADVVEASLTDATYSLLVTNRGDATARDVAITGAVPANMTFSGRDREVTGCSPGAAAGTVCRWAVGDLAPSSSRTVEVTYDIEQLDAAYEQSSPQYNFSNKVSAEAANGGGTPTDTDVSLVRGWGIPTYMRDANIDAARSSTNFGACDELPVAADGSRSAFIRNDYFPNSFAYSPSEKMWGAELTAVVKSVSSPDGAPVPIGAHRVFTNEWDEGENDCTGVRPPSDPINEVFFTAASPLRLPGREVTADRRPGSEGAATATAPVAAPGLVRWDVTEALDTDDEQRWFSGFELRAEPGGGTGTAAAFHSTEAAAVADRPRMVAVYTMPEPAGCIDTDPEQASGPADRDYRVTAEVTDSRWFDAPRSVGPGGDGCNGTPIEGAGVGWELDDDSPDAHISSLAGEEVERETGSRGDAAPNRSSTLTGPNGRTFIDIRLADPLAPGSADLDNRIAAIALREHSGYDSPPVGTSDQGTCDPGDPNPSSGEGVFHQGECTATGESETEDDVTMFWGPPDADGDGIADSEDNCPSVANPGQENTKGGGAGGDACEDQDGDGFSDSDDLCPARAGANQGCPPPDGGGGGDGDGGGDGGGSDQGGRPNEQGGSGAEPGSDPPPETRPGPPSLACGGKQATIHGTDEAEEIRGSNRADSIHALDGADTVRPRRGSDSVCAGAGNDRIHAADGERDRIACGDGRDEVFADRKDTLRGCERAHRRRGSH